MLGWVWSSLSRAAAWLFAYPRIIVSTATLSAPLLSNVCAHSWAVDPVVSTSSIKMMCLPEMVEICLRLVWNAPRRFSMRFLRPQRVCVSVLRLRIKVLAHGRPFWRERCFVISSD